MTVAKLSAGDGYTYYISEVASDDVRREAGQELTDYYVAKGNPPGVWLGSGIVALGVSGEVSEVQMKALYGEGLHPDAERLIAAKLAEGASPTEAVKAARLGAAYYQFKQDTSASLVEQTNAEVERFEREQHRSPSPEEHRVIRTKAAGIAFRKDYGRDASTKEELARYISVKSKPARQAVAGFDLQFAPAKTVSTLWALGDESTRTEVEAAHEAAIERTLRWIEKEATATRTGHNGVAQVDVAGGLVATRFRHHDSRAGDPQLHDHVVVANKVMGQDGKWRTIDGRLLYRLSVAASEHYNAAVLEEVCTRLGVAVEAREVTPGKRPVMEVAGIDDRLTTLWSSRSNDVKDRTRQLVEEYRQAHGRQPDERTLIHLAQQATLETRPAKPTARSLPELRTAWRQAAQEIVGPDGVRDVLERARQVAASSTLGNGVGAGEVGEQAESVNVDAAAEQVTATVAEHRAVWGRHHLEAEARRWVTARFQGRDSAPDLVQRITERAAGVQSLSIAPIAPHSDFAPLTRASDGRSIYTQRASDLFTSTAVLDAEDRVLSAARTDVIPAVSVQTFQQVAEASSARLDPGQLALAREFATSSRLVVAGIGPAGTGKTTSLSLLTEAVRAQGGQVIGLAPSARAAEVMSAELGTPAHTMHSWLGQRARAMRRAAGSGTQLQLAEDLQLRAGDVIVVDEAGMAGSIRLAEVVAQADAAGAHVRLIGDPAQLAAVESGGVLRLLASEVGAVELETVWRFADPAEAAASLRLRNGEVAPGEEPGRSAFGWYVDAGRITGGEADAMANAVFAAWQSDTLAGKTSLMLAPDNTTVAELNARAQAFAVASGRVSPDVRVKLRDGLHACPGDVITTRVNDRSNRVHRGADFVKNGDTWTVEQVREDGALEVVHRTHGGRLSLSPEYVQRAVELGYAATVHRAQGATVDTAHALVNDATSREGAYVSLTRGRDRNQLFVATTTGQSMHDVLDAIAVRSTQSVSAHEAIRAEQDRAIDLEHLVDVHADVAERADAQRLQHLVRASLGARAERFIAADGWPGMARSLRDAEEAGVDLNALLRRADQMRPWTPADDDAAVMSWRLDRSLEDVLQARKQAGAASVAGGGNSPASAATDPLAALDAAAEQRPLGTLSEEQLTRLEATATAVRAHARAAQVRQALRENAGAMQPAPIVVDGAEHPAWTERKHGSLDPAQLHEAIAATRGRARYATGDQARQLHRQLSDLQDERRLRKVMDRRSYTAETVQREAGRGLPSTSSAAATAGAAGTEQGNRRLIGTPAERTARAELLHARIAGERRLRTRLAPAQPAPAAPDELPEWIAPSRAVTDANTPAAWREHLTERRAFLLTRLHETGEQIAAEAPAWASELGPVPLVDDPARKRWTQLAGSIELWRRQHRIPTTAPTRDGETAAAGAGEALPREPDSARPDAPLSRRELVAAQLREQVRDLRRELGPDPSPTSPVVLSQPEQPAPAAGDWRQLVAGLSRPESGAGTVVEEVRTATAAAPATTSAPAASSTEPTQEATVSRHTFTTDTEQWTVGYDPVMESFYAQVEPVPQARPAADVEQVVDQLRSDRADRSPTTEVDDAVAERVSEDAPRAAPATGDRVAQGAAGDAERPRQEGTAVTAQEPTTPTVDGDELRDVVGDRPGQVPTVAELERLLSDRVQLPQAVVEQLVAETPQAPDVPRAEERLAAAERMLTDAREDGEELQQRWEAIKKSARSGRSTRSGQQPSPVQDAAASTTPANVRGAEVAADEDARRHQPDRAPGRGPRI